MNFKKKLFAFVLCAVALSALLVFGAFATDASATTGYTFDSDGTTYTNIKWTVTTEGSDKIVTFEIDASATDKKASTVLYGVDPVTGKTGEYSTPIQNGWGQLSGITKAVIKEGITKIDGGLFDLNRTVTLIEIPTSLKEISNGSVFQGCRALTSIYIAGNEPITGVYDISGVEILKNNVYTFDSCPKMTALKLNPALKGELNTEFIKSAPITELEIPEGVTKLNDRSLTATNSLKTLTILGMETTFASDDVFKSNTAYPAIKAKAGSKAAEFAKANGYTFIDLDTGEEIKGTKPAPAEQTTGGTTTGGTTTGGTTTGGTTTGGSTSFPIGLEAFDPNECTAYGYIGGTYYDTYWVYYQETKTLKFFTNKASGWNETGRCDKAEDKTGWKEYKNEIEYVEIGPQLAKVTSLAFQNHTALKEVKLGKDITQIDPSAFSGCTALTTVWYDGGERVEGRCDLTKVRTVNSIMNDTAIKEVLLAPNPTMAAETLGFNLKTILAPNITDVLITYAKDNGYELRSTTDPNVVYDYYIDLPDDSVMCGPRCGFGFDEATGTLTIYGSGEMSDLINYYGGGSKTSPWFDIKQQIKHVVISEYVISIGKYNFTQCENLETVQIPNVESFAIENSAFEKCTNLRSIYRAGTEPIEGTLDLSNVNELKAWTFAYDYLIANVILSPQITSIGTSTFEENIGINLANIYGTPGTYAETFASENGKTFYDISSNTPQAIKCEIPETTEAPVSADTTAPESVETSPVTTAAEVTENPLFVFEDEDVTSEGTGEGAGEGAGEDEGGSMLPIIIAVAGVVIIAVVVVIIIKKKKS